MENFDRRLCASGRRSICCRSSRPTSAEWYARESSVWKCRGGDLDGGNVVSRECAFR